MQDKLIPVLRASYLCCCAVLLNLIFSPPAIYAGWFGPDTLVTIDGEKYTTEDFEKWWEQWREEGMRFPDTPKEFVDWLLLSREAERMQLYEDPVFKKKILTFLKVRGLMQLKYDEVDSKIEITDSAIEARYRERYVPRRRVTFFFFKELDKANAFYQALKGGNATLDMDAGSLKKRGIIQVQTRVFRPFKIGKMWKGVVSGLHVGEVSQPIKWQKLFVVLRLDEVLGEDPQDLKKVRSRIKKELTKEEEARLTVELVDRLKEKYHVKVDVDRLKGLDVEKEDDNCSQQPIIQTDKGIVTQCEFLKQVRRLQRFNAKYGFKKEDGEAVKLRVLNGILSETLTSWEAIDRHYEDRPPLDKVYWFYRRHRLIKALESKLFVPDIHITDKDIEAYYKEHIHDYTTPEIVRIAIIDGNETQIKRLWTEVITGADFLKASKKISPHGATVRDVPFNHLEETTKQVVKKLSKGEVSRPVDIKGHLAIIKLLDRKPARPLPLEKVKRQIRERIFSERLARLKEDFLAKIRSRSDITINHGAWEKLKRKMGKQHEEKRS